MWGTLRREVQPFYDAYENIFNGPGAEDPAYISNPLPFVHAKVKIPRLSLKNPYVRCRARTPFTVPSQSDAGIQGVPVPTQVIGADGQTSAQVRDNVRGAEILEAAVNYELREMGFKQQVKLVLLDTLFAGYGALKLGYDTEYTYDPAAEAEEKVRSMVEGDDPRRGLEWDELIKRESVWAKRVSPWDMLWDPDIKQLDPWLSSARWVAFRSIRPLADVRKDPIYKNVKFLEATATSRQEAERAKGDDMAQQTPDRVPGSKGVGELGGDTSDLREGYVVLWEIWCKKDRKVYVLAEGHDKWLREDDWPFDMEGPPFAFLHFHDVPDNRWPMSDIAAWFDHNELLNLCTSMDADAVKRRINKILFAKGAIEPDQLKKLQAPLNSQICEVNNPDAIKPFKSETSGMDAGMFSQRLMLDIYQASGIGENQRGGEAQGDKTATEQKIVEYNVAARLAEEQDRVNDWATVAIRKIIQIMQQLFTKQRLAPIIGRDPQEWVAYTRDQIQGEYDINVELAPYNPMKAELAIKQITDMIALLSKIAPMGFLPGGNGQMVSVNLGKLVEDLLRQMSPAIKPQDILIPLPMSEYIQIQQRLAASGMGPPAPMMGMQPPQSGAPPGSGPSAGVPMPGEGRGADKRSQLASQGAGRAAVQGVREGGNQLAGASSPSRGY